MIISQWLDSYLLKMTEFPKGILETDNLLHWRWFVWNFLAIIILTALFSRDKKRSWRRLKAHLRSRRARHETIMDIQFFILKILYQPLKIILFTPLFLFLGKISKDQGVVFIHALGLVEKTSMAGAPAHVFKALWILLAYDFAYYWSHRVQHRIEFFWHLHSVHHRATYLSPLLKYRTHPLDTLINNVFSFTLGAFAMGVFNALYTIRGSGSDYDIFYLGAVFFCHFIFGHIRHSQYWISYGPYLSRIFMSPAMHQIHHSHAPQHHGKNLATMFSLWDFMFGTLYIPQKKEVLKFGDTPAIRNEEKTVWKEVKQPMVYAFHSLPRFSRWVSTTAAVSALVVFFLASCSDAKEPETPCKDLREISLPAVVVNTLASKHNQKIYLPIARSACFGSSGSLALKDPYGKIMGRFYPDKRWQGYYSDDLERKTENQLAFDYAALLLKEGVNASLMAPMLVSMIFPQETLDEKKRLQVWSGNFDKTGSYYFDDQNLSGDPLSPQPQIISYQGLIEGIVTHKSVFSDIPFGARQGWRIPTTKFALPLQTDRYLTKIMTLASLQQEALFGSKEIKGACAKSAVIFYGAVGVSPDFFNTFDWLRAVGCKDISWLENGYLEWQLPLNKDRFLAEQKGEYIASASEVKGKTSSSIVVDLRDASVYKMGHIPGAMNFPLQSIGASPLNEKKNFVLYNFSAPVFENLVKAIKDKRTVFFYLDRKDPINLPYLKRLLRNFQQQQKVTAKLYLGGFQDWSNRARWMGDSDGYGIEVSN